MIHIKTHVLVTDKLQEVHQVIRLKLVRIRLVGTMNGHKRKRDVTKICPPSSTISGIAQL